MTCGSKLFVVLVLISLLRCPALELFQQGHEDITEPQMVAKGMRRNLAAKTATRKSKLPVRSGAAGQLSIDAEEETSMDTHSPHEVHRFAVHERRKRSIGEEETLSSGAYITRDDKDKELTRSLGDEAGSDEGYAMEDSGDQELFEQQSAWPKFGIVGERQAALYYSSFLVFSAFLYRNSGGANSRGPNNLPKSGRY